MISCEQCCVKREETYICDFWTLRMNTGLTNKDKKIVHDYNNDSDNVPIQSVSDFLNVFGPQYPLQKNNVILVKKIDKCIFGKLKNENLPIN
jgi:hypothetical protein